MVTTKQKTRTANAVGVCMRGLKHMVGRVDARHANKAACNRVVQANRVVIATVAKVGGSVKLICLGVGNPAVNEWKGKRGEMKEARCLCEL